MKQRFLIPFFSVYTALVMCVFMRTLWFIAFPMLIFVGLILFYSNKSITQVHEVLGVSDRSEENFFGLRNIIVPFLVLLMVCSHVYDMQTVKMWLKKQQWKRQQAQFFDTLEHLKVSAEIWSPEEAECDADD